MGSGKTASTRAVCSASKAWEKVQAKEGKRPFSHRRPRPDVGLTSFIFFFLCSPLVLLRLKDGIGWLVGWLCD